MLWHDWLSLFVRWFHVIAGVAWIGASFYFIWLDNNLQTPPQWKQDKGIKGDLWAVHGGGFYEIGKYQYGPEQMPTPLHWFKWEAYTTWLSGFLLLTLVYYMGAAAYLIDPAVMVLTPLQAISMGVALVFGGWVLYELACRSKLARYPWAFAAFLLILLTLASWLACHWFSGRGAYMHIGALIGTMMVGNVLFNIIPSQKKMVAAVAARQPIDPAWGAGAKLRSVHNNYLTLPLLFIMISNHYPMTYQHSFNWLVLIAIAIVSAWIRHFFNLRHRGQVKPSILVSGAAGMILIALWVSWPTVNTASAATPSTSSQSSKSAVAAVNPVVTLLKDHCAQCHSAAPTDEMFKVAPMGVKLDTQAEMQQMAARIYVRVVQSKDMPFLNKTHMTDAQRQQVADWYKQLQATKR